MRELRITITLPLSDDTFEQAKQVASIGESVEAFTPDLTKAGAVIKHETVTVRAKSNKPRAKKAKLAEVA